MGLLLTPQAICHARSLGESLAGRTSSSSDSERVRIEFNGKASMRLSSGRFYATALTKPLPDRVPSVVDLDAEGATLHLLGAHQNIQISVDNSAHVSGMDRVAV